MDDAKGMEVLQGFEDVQEDEGCLCLCENSVFFHEAPEVAFLSILHDEVDALIVLDHFV